MKTLTVTDFDIFNKIKTNLLAQGCQSLQKNGDCSYRGLSEYDYEVLEMQLSNEFEVESKTIISAEDYEDYEYSDEYFDELSMRINKYIEHMSDDDIRLKKCAAGHIISGSHYNLALEGSGIDDNNVWDTICESNKDWDINKNSRLMILLTQRVHDLVEVRHWNTCFEVMSSYFTDQNTFDGYKLMLDSRVPDVDESTYPYEYCTSGGFIGRLFDLIRKDID